MTAAQALQHTEIAPPQRPAQPSALARRERRIWPRSHVSLFGLVSFGKFTAMRCLVKDYHFDGARLKIHGPEEVPSSFELFVPVINLQRRVHVRWRKGDEVGVQFGV